MRPMPSLPDLLRRALASPLPGLDAQLRMAPRPRTALSHVASPEGLRQAAALILIYPHEGHWHVLLTVRGSNLRHHTGQVSLPGGRIEPDETVEQAALREALEEVGVPPSSVDVLGRLTPLPIAVSGHLLHPVVGSVPERPAFTLAPDEVDRLLEVPLAHLRRPDIVAWEQRERVLPPLGVMDVPYFDVVDARVWGATAMVLAEFLAVLDVAGA
jgi:8-oxo-dGTP pyrophosphatase MutT (NUDIX family)